jgi:hypothetical protein
MSTDLIRYDLLVQEALKQVVRKVLTDAAREGLPGEHHFYVSFRTTAPGVKMSSRLRERYPQEMTVVLQHQFWDLAVTEQAFEVGLSFSGVAEKLSVPFEALSGFFDPSVQFGLKFELAETAEVADAKEGPAKPADAAVPLLAAVPAEPKGAEAPPVAEGAAAAGAEVVSLDAFRKKS